MKTIKIALLVVAIAFTSTVSASTDPIKTETSISKVESIEVAKAISHLLDKPAFSIENELKAYVIFTLNKENEIVVLTVKTEDVVIENFIKSRLNYNKLNVKLNPAKRYGVPITIKEE